MAVSVRAASSPSDVIASSAEIAAPARWRDFGIVLIIALLAAGYVVLRGTSDREASDFDQLWQGARAVFRGQNPYSYIGPFGEFEWSYLYYPMPALLIVSPLALLPLLAARACFAAVSAGLLATALLRERPMRLLMFLSAPMLIALGRGQFTPILFVAAYFPSMAWLGVAKPNIALAVLFGCQQPRRAIYAAAIGGAVLTVSSFIVDPSWFSSWLNAISHKSDGWSVLRNSGAGFVIVAALLRWRRNEARLLFALGSVPQTPTYYDAVPLFIVSRGFRETALLVIGGNLALLLLVIAPGLRTDEIGPMYADRVMLWLLVCLYLPATLMVVRRPNDFRPVPEKGFNGGRVDVAIAVLLAFSAFFAGWAILSRFL
jgi:hypothetical protein